MSDARQKLAEHEIKRLRAGLQMIADGMTVPDAFSKDFEKWCAPEQSHKSALLIAQATLEGGDYRKRAKQFRARPVKKP